MPSDQSGRRPTWFRLVGTLLMLPIGIIVALVLIYFATVGGVYVPGEFFLILLIVFLCLFVARMLFWGTRRRYWRQYRGEQDPVRILRVRYARGEITREQFDQMVQDLEHKKEVL